MNIPGLLLFLKLTTSTLSSFSPLPPPMEVQLMTQQGLVRENEVYFGMGI